MAQKSLLEYSTVHKKAPKEEESKAETPYRMEVSHEAVKEKKKHSVFPPISPDNLPPSYFVSATYDGRTRKAVIKLYEPESGKIFYWEEGFNLAIDQTLGQMLEMMRKEK